MLDRNKNKGAQEQWNLKGLLIGNGWIDPPSQYLAYLPYAYREGIIQGGSEIAKKVEAQQSVCINALQAEGKGKVDTGVCEKVMTDILELTQDKNGDPMKKCINMYDIRLRDDASCGMNWPPDLSEVTPYLRRPDVIQALHVDPDKRTGWTECSGSVSSNFRAANSKPSIEFLPALLEEVPIVLYSGDRDLICNHMGTESLISGLKFNGGTGFELSPGVTAPRRDWTFEGEPAGFWQEARNLTYVVFYNSSHMVPFDYPRRTRDMLDRVIGVDIASVGGKPVNSQIDGEKGPVTSVGGHPNSTAAEEEQKEKLKEAEWRAYQKSGEVVLVLLIIAVSVWGFFIWRSRRRRAGYKGLSTFGDGGSREALSNGMGLENFRDRRDERDLEAADFDEHELEESESSSNGARKEGYHSRSQGKEYAEENKKLFENGEMERDRYSIGGDSDEETKQDAERR
jgi:carboxypeptidase D